MLDAHTNPLPICLLRFKYCPWIGKRTSYDMYCGKSCHRSGNSTFAEERSKPNVGKAQQSLRSAPPPPGSCLSFGLFCCHLVAYKGGRQRGCAQLSWGKPEGSEAKSLIGWGQPKISSGNYHVCKGWKRTIHLWISHSLCSRRSEQTFFRAGIGSPRKINIYTYG